MTNHFYVTPDHYAQAEARGIAEENVRQRVYDYGWTIERAITEPVRKQVPFHSEYIELAKANGIPLKAFRVRVRTQGWDELEAATTPVMTVKEAAKRSADKRRKYTDEHLAIMKKNNIPIGTVSQRRNKLGWTLEEAINTPVMSYAERTERMREAARKRKMLDEL